MKRTIALLVLSMVFALVLPIACKKSSAEEQNCKTCKVFGGDNHNVIHEEVVCTDKQESDLHSRFPGREIKCQ